ncbi:hypothetical protein Vadar_018993 [Vaccinium darrowii]|uniref:Uncharacterized protein n=1 Tax=Vaccinium darrowii TaxID=229202 RepID=A0ACB7Z5R4_9ERIC|nr:hypothetical protein Vadar_018993 [Vaccinium darrowii]
MTKGSVKAQEEDIEWLERSIVAKLHAHRDVDSISEAFRSDGVFNIHIRAMEGNLVLLTFPSSHDMNCMLEGGELSWLSNCPREILSSEGVKFDVKGMGGDDTFLDKRSNVIEHFEEKDSSSNLHFAVGESVSPSGNGVLGSQEKDMAQINDDGLGDAESLERRDGLCSTCENSNSVDKSISLEKLLGAKSDESNSINKVASGGSDHDYDDWDLVSNEPLIKYVECKRPLYAPESDVSTDYGINTWINCGLPANKLVLGLPFYGYAWTLVNPDDNSVGAPAKGTAITNGSMSYKVIKGYIQRYGAVTKYNATYVMNYCVIGSSWIAYDDVDVVKIKVAYAKKRNLLGYFVWQVPYDDDWVLSQAAQEAGKDPRNKRHSLLLVILLPTAATVTLLLVSATWYLRKRARRNKGLMDEEKESQSLFKTTMASAGNANDSELSSEFFEEEDDDVSCDIRA